MWITSARFEALVVLALPCRIVKPTRLGTERAHFDATLASTIKVISLIRDYVMVFAAGREYPFQNWTCSQNPLYKVTDGSRLIVYLL